MLRKRDQFREVFAGFDFERVARFGSPDIERLVLDASIIRHGGRFYQSIWLAALVNSAQSATTCVAF